MSLGMAESLDPSPAGLPLRDHHLPLKRDHPVSTYVICPTLLYSTPCMKEIFFSPLALQICSNNLYLYENIISSLSCIFVLVSFLLSM
jgi:hypothetical protein